MDSHPWKREPHRKAAYCNLGYLPSGFLPIETLEQCILNSRTSAATKIQSVWRGYRSRKAFRQNKSKLQETKAAIIIQRSVQEWLHKKKTGEFLLKPDDGNVYYLEKVDEEKIPALQQKIDQWNRDNDANFECAEQLQLQLATVQEQLKSFYEKAATRNSRMKRCEAVCTQIEAIASLLTDLPSIAHCDQADISMFRTPLVPDARTARLRHKQQLKALHAPWWKRLNLQTEHIV